MKIKTSKKEITIDNLHFLFLISALVCTVQTMDRMVPLPAQSVHEDGSRIPLVHNASDNESLFV